MSFFEKLKFWKHDDEFDFDKMAEKEMGLGDQPSGLDQEQKKRLGLDEPSAFSDQHLGSSFQPSAPAPPAYSGGNRDLELINSKLDTIKALLSSLDQRMSYLERGSTDKKQPGRLW